MSANLRNYENILEIRKQDVSSLIWVSRELNPRLAYKQGLHRPTPRTHKEDVLNSSRIKEVINKLSKIRNVSKLVLEKQVEEILEEIGYNKSLKVIRWLGLILIKICVRISTGVYVNIDRLLQLKAEMEHCPVVFVPSHRSYADFILMSCLCFNYDIAIPAIAAGMDFHGMWGMGTILRDTGAFFMRRSYNDDGLYWTTFKQYVYQLVTKGDLPIEFFIEGTRSRSNKSLVPKYGLISMVLKPFFFSEVPDIKFVPINISYDRILEETLFAFELLGVPKPKESTSGFFKSLKIIKECFGKIYFHFGESISAKDFFGNKLDRSVHNMGPLHLQEITENEKALIPHLAHKIVQSQQKCAIITVFNLVSLVLNHNLVTRKQSLTMDELIREVVWLRDVIQKLGAFVFTEDINESIEECFKVHQNLIELRSDNRIYLVQNNIILDTIDPLKLKAHSLSEQCMTFSVPFVMLQMYINPILHYFIDVALIVIILNYQKSLNAETLFKMYHFLRSLFSVEFVIALPRVKTEFQNSLQYLTSLGLVNASENSYELGDNRKLQEFLYTMFEPFLISYFVTVVVLERSPAVIDDKNVLVSVQKILENKIINGNEFVHPYCLNLDTLSNCLNALTSLGALNKTRSHNTVLYETRKNDIVHIKEELGNYMSKCHIEDSFAIHSYIKNKL